jgi:hypothetical protein
MYQQSDSSRGIQGVGSNIVLPHGEISNQNDNEGLRPFASKTDLSQWEGNPQQLLHYSADFVLK